MIRFTDTSIINVETGEDLTKTLAIGYGATITLENYGINKARCEIVTCEVDVTAHETAWFTKHPVTDEYGPLAALIFRDGTKVEFDERGVPTVTTPTDGSAS